MSFEKIFSLRNGFEILDMYKYAIVIYVKTIKDRGLKTISDPYKLMISINLKKNHLSISINSRDSRLRKCKKYLKSYTSTHRYIKYKIQTILSFRAAKIKVHKSTFHVNTYKTY